MFRASSATSAGGYSCTCAAYGTVTLYESSWWPVGTQLKLCTNRPPRTLIQSDSTICCTCTTVSSCRCSTWGSKHVEENIIFWINNNQCIKLVIKWWAIWVSWINVLCDRTQSLMPIPVVVRSAAASLLGLRVRIPLRPWMLVSCVSISRYRPLRPADHSFRGVSPGVKGKVHSRTGDEVP